MYICVYSKYTWLHVLKQTCVCVTELTLEVGKGEGESNLFSPRGGRWDHAVGQVLLIGLKHLL